MSRTYTSNESDLAKEFPISNQNKSEMIPLICISLIGFLGLVACLILGG